MVPRTALAHGIVGAEADQGRRHRARQQDRMDGLGHYCEGAGATRNRSHSGGFNEIGAGHLARTRRLGEGGAALNVEPVFTAIRRNRRGTPEHRDAGTLIGTRPAQGAHGDGHVNCANRPNTWLH